MKYEIIIYWSVDDNAFIAEVPALPGCAADGSTYQEALDNVQVVILEWIETANELGRTPPEPKKAGRTPTRDRDMQGTSSALDQLR